MKKQNTNIKIFILFIDKDNRLHVQCSIDGKVRNIDIKLKGEYTDENKPSRL